jgi:hypothetical protein
VVHNPSHIIYIPMYYSMRKHRTPQQPQSACC